MHGWSRTEDSIRWVTRLTQPATFDVGIAYDALKKSVGGTYVVKLKDQSVSGTVQETPTDIIKLGRVTVTPGPVEIAVEATKIQGGELLRLRAITLTPVVEGAAADTGKKPAKGKPAPAAKGKKGKKK